MALVEGDSLVDLDWGDGGGGVDATGRWGGERETKGVADSRYDGLGRRWRWRRDLSARSGAWPIWIEGGGGRVREKRIEGGVARVCFGWGYLVSLGAFTKLTWLFGSCARVTRDSWG